MNYLKRFLTTFAFLAALVAAAPAVARDWICGTSEDDYRMFAPGEVKAMWKDHPEFPEVYDMVQDWHGTLFEHQRCTAPQGLTEWFDAKVGKWVRSKGLVAYTSAPELRTTFFYVNMRDPGQVNAGDVAWFPSDRVEAEVAQASFAEHQAVQIAAAEEREWLEGSPTRRELIEGGFQVMLEEALAEVTLPEAARANLREQLEDVMITRVSLSNQEATELVLGLLLGEGITFDRTLSVLDDFNRRLQELQEEVAAARGGHDTLAERLAAMQQSIEQAGQAGQPLTDADLRALPGYRALEVAIANVDSTDQVAELRGQVNGLKTAVEGIEHYDDSALRRWIGRLETQLNDLGDVLERLAIVEADLARAASTDEVADIRGEVRGLNAAIKAFDNSALQQQVGALEVRIGEIEARVTTAAVEAAEQAAEAAVDGKVDAYWWGESLVTWVLALFMLVGFLGLGLWIWTKASKREVQELRLGMGVLSGWMTDGKVNLDELMSQLNRLKPEESYDFPVLASDADGNTVQGFVRFTRKPAPLSGYHIENVQNVTEVGVKPTQIGAMLRRAHESGRFIVT